MRCAGPADRSVRRNPAPRTVPSPTATPRSSDAASTDPSRGEHDHMDDSLGFWEAFFLLLIWIPLVLIWIFALVDIFRRDDIGGGAKALWVIVVILLPFV